MPDAILIIVTVQTVPGLKNLWTCPMTGTAPIAVSTPINTTLLTVFIVGRFLGEDAVTATEGRRPPLHPGFYAAHECWGTLDVAARRLEPDKRGVPQQQEMVTDRACGVCSIAHTGLR